MEKRKGIMIESRRRKIVLWDDMISNYEKKIDRLSRYIDEADEDIDRLKKGFSPKVRKWN